MAYLETINCHAYPLKNKTHPEPALPASILFPRGPEYEWRFQRNQSFDKLDNRFMYKDQGPPAYRLLGPHYNMYATPNKLDYSSYSKSFHYEPRHYNAPHYRNNSVSFPTGPPPAQVAMFDGVKPRRPLDPVSRCVYVCLCVSVCVCVCLCVSVCVCVCHYVFLTICTRTMLCGGPLGTSSCGFSASPKPGRCRWECWD